MTLTQRERASYRSIRKNGRRNSDCMLPEKAIDALRQVKWQKRIDAIPFHYDGDTWETEDGFTVVIKIEGDYGYTLEDYLGDSYGHVTGGKPDRNGIDGVTISCERYGRERTYWPNKHWTFADRLAQYRKAGMARHDAYLAAMSGLKREAEKYESMVDNGVEIVWLQCKAYRTDDYDVNGDDADELGEDSIGGADGESWQDTLADYTLHENALEQAREHWAQSLADNAREQEQSRPDLYANTVEKV